MQVAAVEAEGHARLASQARLHDQAVEQLQQERKREKEAHEEKLQLQVDGLTSCLLCCACSKLLLTHSGDGA